MAQGMSPPCWGGGGRATASADEDDPTGIKNDLADSNDSIHRIDRDFVGDV